MPDGALRPIQVARNAAIGGVDDAERDTARFELRRQRYKIAHRKLRPLDVGMEEGQGLACCSSVRVHPLDQFRVQLAIGRGDLADADLESGKDAPRRHLWPPDAHAASPASWQSRNPSRMGSSMRMYFTWAPAVKIFFM
jgi:hypothetical protein